MVNVTLNTKTRSCLADSTFLGYEGENSANKLVFNFEDGFIDGSAQLNIKRGSDDGFVALKKVGETYELDVMSSLLSQIGEITFQLQVSKSDGTIYKYDTFDMMVKDAIDTDAELPEDYPTWQEAIATALAQVENIDIYANKIDNVTTVAVTDKNGIITEVEIYDGQDGYSPTAIVGQTPVGSKLTITDKNGETTVDIVNGVDGYTPVKGVDYVDGKDGYTPQKGIDYDDGEDGFSPTVQLTDNGDVVELSITDKNGTQTANLREGLDGFSPIANVVPISNGARITITDVNGTTATDVNNGTNGTNGNDGVGIKSVAKTNTVGLVDTYTITFTDNTQTTFTVTNGKDGTGISFEVVSTLPSTGASDVIYLVPSNTSENQNIYDEYIYANGNFELIGNTAVDLSNVYTSDEVDNLLNSYATVTALNNAKASIPTKTSQLTNDSNFVSDVNYTHTDNNYTTAEKTKLSQLENYDDTELRAMISAKPNASDIPTKVSELQNDSNFINSIPGEYVTESELEAKGYITEHQDISGKQDKLIAGDNITIEGNVISSTGGGGGIAELPIASADVLGGIKVGEGLEITEDGILSAIAGAGGTGRTETSLLANPVEYALATNGGQNNINQDLTLLQSIENYDEIAFVWDINVDGGHALQNEKRLMPSHLIYNNSDTAVFNGASLQLNYASSAFFVLEFWFKNGSTLRIANTQTNIKNWRAIRIKDIIGIKY